MVFALYANLALAGRTWIERGQVPAALGLWWVHGLFLLVSLVALGMPTLRRLVRRRLHSS
jgi:lipopolysaccharide export system permease protein